MKTYKQLKDEERKKIEKGLKRVEELQQYYKYIIKNLGWHLSNVDEQKRWETFERKKELKVAIAQASKHLEEETFSVNAMREQLEKGVEIEEVKKDETK